MSFVKPAKLWARLPEVEIRNQAKVHLWFEDHFGTAFDPLTSTEAGIERYASIPHMVGIRLLPDGRFDVYAPRGLDAIFSFQLLPNRAIDNRATHKAKSRRCLELWPELTYTAWGTGTTL